MKQKIIPFTLALAFVVVATPVLAQDVRANLSGRATVTPVRTPAEVRVELEARRASTTANREERRENIQERKASSTERRVVVQRELAQRKAEHAARVLRATVERLEKIIARLESRIVKVEAAGGTATEAKAFVAEARAQLSLATSGIATFASVDLSGDKAQENFERVRNLAAEIKDHLRGAHQSLMKAVRALKGASTGVRREGDAVSSDSDS